MVNRAFDVLVDVLKSDSKPVETMSLDVDVSVSIDRSLYIAIRFITDTQCRIVFVEVL